MSNMNVLKRLDRIETELSAVRHYISIYHGVPASEATHVDRRAERIIETAAEIAVMAREAMGNRSAKSLVTKIRKALGFTYP
jgi:hypothetical protein